MKLTLIAQGSSPAERQEKRWGVSFLIGGETVFDTFGREDVFRENVERYGIDITRVRHVVISHDDWDHVAGLGYLLSNAPHARVYLCRGGARALERSSRDAGAAVSLVGGAREISPGIWTMGSMPAHTAHGDVIEQAVAVSTEKGLSVLTGCAHPGIVPIVKRAAGWFGKAPYAVCGGFHMKDSDDVTNERAVQELRRMGVQQVAPLHCTGEAACGLFRRCFGDGYVGLAEGGSIEL
ncbi:MAG TPA: MBL fold metallo-hydrolase [bacterium]|nr:MBL fold metallo-hydrolase [bacterium]